MHNEETTAVHMVMTEPEAAVIAWGASMVADYFDANIHLWESKSDDDIESLMRMMSLRFTAKKIQYEISKLIMEPDEFQKELGSDPTTDEIEAGEW